MWDIEMQASGVSVIILGAGAGRRMGRTKQLLPFGANTLLGRVVDIARPAGPVILVLGHKAQEIRASLDCNGITVVENPEWPTGQASSLKAGLGAVPDDCRGALFMLGDQPLVRLDTLVALQQSFRRTGKQILIPGFRGRRGNPVLIGKSLFSHVMGLSGDTGARVLFKRFSDQVLMLDVDDPGVCMDADTWEDYQALLTAAGK